MTLQAVGETISLVTAAALVNLSASGWRDIGKQEYRSGMKKLAASFICGTAAERALGNGRTPGYVMGTITIVGGALYASGSYAYEKVSPLAIKASSACLRRIGQFNRGISDRLDPDGATHLG